MPKENNSNNYVSTKEQKNKRKGGEKKKEKGERKKSGKEEESPIRPIRRRAHEARLPPPRLRSIQLPEYFVGEKRP